MAFVACSTPIQRSAENLPRPILKRRNTYAFDDSFQKNVAFDLDRNQVRIIDSNNSGSSAGGDADIDESVKNPDSSNDDSPQNNGIAGVAKDSTSQKPTETTIGTNANGNADNSSGSDGDSLQTNAIASVEIGSTSQISTETTIGSNANGIADISSNLSTEFFELSIHDFVEFSESEDSTTDDDNGSERAPKSDELLLPLYTSARLAKILSFYFCFYW